jgi:hypothetical protein
VLKGKSGVKNLSLEYASHPSADQNRSAATEWADALALCVERANTLARIANT